MTTPKWVRQPAQPIALDDVAALPRRVSRLPPFEGIASTRSADADVVTYGDLLRLYGDHQGLRRLILPVPVLSPGLSGWWLYLFTPKQPRSAAARRVTEVPDDGHGR